MSPRNPSGTREQRVARALHEAGHVGLTVAQVAEAAELKPYDAKTVCRKLWRAGHAVLLAARQNSTTQQLEEVYGCSCPTDHRPPGTRAEEWRPLTEAEKERGLAGVAAARAALDGQTS